MQEEEQTSDSGVSSRKRLTLADLLRMRPSNDEPAPADRNDAIGELVSPLSQHLKLARPVSLELAAQIVDVAPSVARLFEPSAVHQLMRDIGAITQPFEGVAQLTGMVRQH